MAELVERGWPIEYLLDLDMVSFKALSDSSTRVNAILKQERAWVQHIAAQGSSKGLKQITKPWDKEAKTGLSPEALGNDGAAFLDKFGKGF